MLESIEFNKDIEWIKDRTILLTVTGSHAYGTNIESSDIDYKGICIPPIDYYFGLQSFNEYNNSGGKNFKNKAGDVDISIIHINKFVKDAMLGVPNNIEILFNKESSYIKLSPLGKKLIDNRHLFLSKNIIRKFDGYAISQIRKMKNKKYNGTGRQDLIENFGYDTKFFMHAVRLLTSAIEILNTCDFATYRPNREFLLECRNGKYSFEEACKIIEQLKVDLDIACKQTKLPSKPNYNKINQLLVEINKESLTL